MHIVYPLASRARLSTDKDTILASNRSENSRWDRDGNAASSWRGRLVNVGIVNVDVDDIDNDTSVIHVRSYSRLHFQRFECCSTEALCARPRDRLFLFAFRTRCSVSLYRIIVQHIVSVTSVSNLLICIFDGSSFASNFMSNKTDWLQARRLLM